jgi:hypothetical protein
VNQLRDPAIFEEWSGLLAVRSGGRKRDCDSRNLFGRIALSVALYSAPVRLTTSSRGQRSSPARGRLPSGSHV